MISFIKKIKKIFSPKIAWISALGSRTITLPRRPKGQIRVQIVDKNGDLQTISEDIEKD